MILKAFVLPGLPQPLLTPTANPGYQKLRQAFDRVRQEIVDLSPDVIIVYSTMWASILGHQVQVHPRLKWVHVDEEFHDLGKMPYDIRVDAGLGRDIVQFGNARGLQMKATDYHGFPVDTGTVVVHQLVNPDSKIPMVVVSSNIYADRAETVVLGKAAADALAKQNKKAVAIIVSSLSNRLHPSFISPADDKIQSLKDQEWNLKILEFLEQGRLEDVSQLSRQIHREARVKKVGNFKPFWWLSAVMGSHNRYKGEVLAYEPVYGVGCAVVGLTPAEFASRDLEFDEDSPDVYSGERNVLADNQVGDHSMSSQSLDPGQESEQDS